MRNRTWSLGSPTFTRDGNRLSFIDGSSSSEVNNMMFTPTYQLIDWVSIGFNSFTPTLIVSGTSSPITLKWKLLRGSLPVSTTIQYKKNNGAAINLNQNTPTGVTFTNGNTITLGINISLISGTGSFDIALFNVSDNTQCSNTLTVNVAQIGSGGN